jgi:hypothetical protein
VEEGSSCLRSLCLRRQGADAARKALGNRGEQRPVFRASPFSISRKHSHRFSAAFLKELDRVGSTGGRVICETAGGRRSGQVSKQKDKRRS